MRKLVIGSVCALALAVVFGATKARAAGQDVTVQVKVDGLPAGSRLNVTMNVGGGNITGGGLADPKGDVLAALSIGSMPKGQTIKVDIYLADCPNKEVRAWIILQGQKPNDNCGSKKVGAALFDGGHRKVTVLIHYKTGVATGNSSGGGGLFTPRNEIIMGGAGAAVVVVILTTGDDEDYDDGGSQTPGGTFSFLDYNGNYSGSLSKQSDTGCNFSVTASVTGTLTLTVSGTGTWVKTHTSAGQTFSFNVSAEKASAGINYVSTPIMNRTIGAGTYTISDSGSITKSGSTYTNTITQTFTGTNGTSCVVVYKGTMTMSK